MGEYSFGKECKIFPVSYCEEFINIGIKQISIYRLTAYSTANIKIQNDEIMKRHLEKQY